MAASKSKNVDLHPELARVLEYWQARYLKAGRVPALRDIELMDFYDIADRMIIADRVGEIPDETYYWRFAGTTLRDISGMELTGKHLHETHDAETTAAAVEVYRKMAIDGQPHYWARPAGVIDLDRSFIHYERVVVPLADDDGALVHLMGVFVFYRRSAQSAETGTTDRVVQIWLPKKTGA